MGLAQKSQITKLAGSMAKLMQKLKYDMLSTRIELQTCILFSEMGK